MKLIDRVLSFISTPFSRPSGRRRLGHAADFYPRDSEGFSHGWRQCCVLTVVLFAGHSQTPVLMLADLGPKWTVSAFATSVLPSAFPQHTGTLHNRVCFDGHTSPPTVHLNLVCISCLGPGGDSGAVCRSCVTPQSVRCSPAAAFTPEICSLLPPCCSVVHQSPAPCQTHTVQGACLKEQGF